ncbi:tRNA A37 threonylcarbamoyladenosine synthetase subunit TsaC/SUA5/YrdC [Mycoplasmopsis mustelae]|uniref:L-threonylcarbamoyladenylate synthase n=1 Tax=Mycoplasmopsis mustelae TaxID=171289 RepID=A0A4R7UDB5_9BACT|nr:Sua5/YciO/YrdC/YwlC family protein [Mycoplasmopsis mustelae]TDV24457.1 tRNA A37 threonylcarbamoyladenosine synthetase subunit TsaC/SUA5/YrdC [Mycoplasmopsis mustelae]
MDKVYDSMFITTTDTVLGIGGPVNDDVLDAIYHLKKRPNDKKVVILVGSISQARQFSQWNQDAEKLAEQLWPGAATIIINNQGFRMPNQTGLLRFLNKNGPMYVSSANISGQLPISLKQASCVFPEIKHIYNFGSGSNQPSTIYNLDTKKVIKRY